MVGEHLGSFRIEDTLGAGAMGVVYKAVHEPTGKVAAVKVIHSDAAGRGKAYERFQREAEILQQFRHPNIVRFLALGRYKGTSYFAMEFVQGNTLDHILNEQGPLPWKQVVEFAVQLADALHYAHEHGVVHRDLKPSNLMITPDGKLKLTDFGIARDLDKTALTADGRTLGTAAYMAPEQIRGITSDISHKTDLYSMGVVLFQMLTGRLPFEGNTAMAMMHGHLQVTPPRPSSKVAEIPKALDDLVFKLMSKNQPDRPWDAAAVGEVLKQILTPIQKGETVQMVWPTEGIDASPSRTSNEVKRTKKKAKSRKGSTGSEYSVDSARDVRRLLETFGMVAALLLILGYVGYKFWPPSAAYYYHQAEKLMASTDRHDWSTAVERFLDPLDKEYPDHPYKEKTQSWRDQLGLEDAEGRAHTLESPVQTPFTKPRNELEQKFQELSVIARSRLEGSNDLGAREAWEELAKQFDPKNSEQRPWHLLAKKRADAITEAMKQRRETVSKLMHEVLVADREGRTVDAQNLFRDLVKKFGKYRDVADVIGPIPPALLENPPTSSAPARDDAPRLPAPPSSTEEDAKP